MHWSILCSICEKCFIHNARDILRKVRTLSRGTACIYIYIYYTYSSRSSSIRGIFFSFSFFFVRRTRDRRSDIFDADRNSAAFRYPVGESDGLGRRGTRADVEIFRQLWDLDATRRVSRQVSNFDHPPVRRIAKVVEYIHHERIFVYTYICV